MSAQALPLEPKPLSQVERVVDTFVAPSKTFKDVLRSTSWWLPYLLIVIGSYVLTFGIDQKVTWPVLVQNEIHANPKSEERYTEAPPAQKAAMEKVMQYSFKGGFYGAPVTNLAALALIALILWPTINFVFAGRATYTQVLAVSSYSLLPGLLKSILAVVLLYVGNRAENFTTEDMVGSSFGSYIESPGALKTFASGFDVFTVWTLVLLAIGLPIVARTKKSSGYLAAFGWWALILLIRTGVAAATAR